MSKKSPFSIIKHRIQTEKALMLNELQNREANPSVRRCKTPKYVFAVDINANKFEIAQAVEEIYAAQNIKVLSVNTLITKPKVKRVRKTNRLTKTNRYKKAIVTLQPGDEIPSQIS
jgi:large subunit ribosomal protein L23